METKVPAALWVNTWDIGGTLCELCTLWDECNGGAWKDDRPGLEARIRRPLELLLTLPDGVTQQTRDEHNEGLDRVAYALAECMLAGPAAEQSKALIAAALEA